MNDKGSNTLAARMAKAVFDLRGKGRSQRPTEIHVSEMDLCAILAVFGQAMWHHGYACGKGLKPPSPIDANGKMVPLDQLRPDTLRATGAARGHGPSDEDVKTALAALHGTVLVPPEGSDLPRISISCAQVGEDSKS